MDNVQRARLALRYYDALSTGRLEYGVVARDEACNDPILADMLDRIDELFCPPLPESTLKSIMAGVIRRLKARGMDTSWLE